MRKNNTYKFIEEISTMSEYKNEVYEILVPLILSKLVFKNSKELKVFTNDIIGLDLPDYIFKSRTILLGRVLKEISNMPIEKAVKINHNIIKFIDNIQDTSTNSKNEKNKNEKKNNSFFSEWNDLINK